jgi:hypothetical protein
MKRTENVVTVLVALIHFGLCCAIRFHLVGVEGSWGWVYALVVDFPASLILVQLMRIADPLLAFGGLGTIWWIVITRALFAAGRWLYAKVHGLARG